MIGRERRAMAFGVRRDNGEMAFAYASPSYSPFTCARDAFPFDPAPGEVKACYKGPVQDQASSPGAGYTLCALESEVCSFRGTALIAFGGPDGYTYKTFTNSVRCTPQSFATDPVAFPTKQCFYRFMGPIAMPSRLENCAVEHRICDVDRHSLVAYGTDTRWSVKTGVSGVIRCSNDSFVDPAVGADKICRSAKTDFTYCAAQGGVCDAPKGATVAFGAITGSPTGRAQLLYVVHDAGGPIDCTVGSFGADPALGVSKHCYFVAKLESAPPPGFTFCALEAAAETCKIPQGSAASFAFGANGKFVFLSNHKNPIACRRSNFRDIDPIPDVPKGCYYRLY